MRPSGTGFGTEQGRGSVAVLFRWLRRRRWPEGPVSCPKVGESCCCESGGVASDGGSGGGISVLGSGSMTWTFGSGGPSVIGVGTLRDGLGGAWLVGTGTLSDGAAMTSGGQSCVVNTEMSV